MLLELQRDSDYDIINEIGSGDENKKRNNISVASEEDSGNLNYVEDQQEADDSSSDQGDIPMHDEEAEDKGGKLVFAMDDGNGSFENNQRKDQGRVVNDIQIFKMS